MATSTFSTEAAGGRYLAHRGVGAELRQDTLLLGVFSVALGPKDFLLPSGFIDSDVTGTALMVS